MVLFLKVGDFQGGRHVGLSSKFGESDSSALAPAKDSDAQLGPRSMKSEKIPERFCLDCLLAAYDNNQILCYW